MIGIFANFVERFLNNFLGMGRETATFAGSGNQFVGNPLRVGFHQIMGFEFEFFHDPLKRLLTQISFHGVLHVEKNR